MVHIISAAVSVILIKMPPFSCCQRDQSSAGHEMIKEHGFQLLLTVDLFKCLFPPVWVGVHPLSFYFQCNLLSPDGRRPSAKQPVK